MTCFHGFRLHSYTVLRVVSLSNSQFLIYLCLNEMRDFKVANLNVKHFIRADFTTGDLQDLQEPWESKWFSAMKRSNWFTFNEIAIWRCSLRVKDSGLSFLHMSNVEFDRKLQSYFRLFYFIFFDRKNLVATGKMCDCKIPEWAIGKIVYLFVFEHEKNVSQCANLLHHNTSRRLFS